MKKTYTLALAVVLAGMSQSSFAAGLGLGQLNRADRLNLRADADKLKGLLKLNRLDARGDLAGLKGLNLSNDVDKLKGLVKLNRLDARGDRNILKSLKILNG